MGDKDGVLPPGPRGPGCPGCPACPGCPLSPGGCPNTPFVGHMHTTANVNIRSKGNILIFMSDLKKERPNYTDAV